MAGEWPRSYIGSIIIAATSKVTPTRHALSAPATGAPVQYITAVPYSFFFIYRFLCRLELPTYLIPSTFGSFAPALHLRFSFSPSNKSIHSSSYPLLISLDGLENLHFDIRHYFLAPHGFEHIPAAQPLQGSSRRYVTHFSDPSGFHCDCPAMTLRARIRSRMMRSITHYSITAITSPHSPVPILCFFDPIVQVARKQSPLQSRFIDTLSRMLE